MKRSNSQILSISWLILSCCLFNLFSTPAYAYKEISSTEVELDYYLANASQYDPVIPTPESVLGFQVGDWHTRPDQIKQYFSALADKSARVKLEVIGYTHEKRPLILVYISSPENIARLEEIRKAHLKPKPPKDTPIVTWMGYSVHGNETSGSNASMLLGYHLSAAKNKQTLKQLEQQVIIIDPMLNPDGLARFSQWVNSYSGVIANADPATLEHHEAWPKGRTNHYWFDLNRDWLLLQHPESQARVAQFHRWRPNILTDFHEMGTNSSYFFQPGVASRHNPLTPEINYQMTSEISEYHARALDKIGSLYYSKESFDDFYYGKGSTYPDVHGSVGILFEQASSRGQVQESVYGGIDFPFAIKNQLTTSLSTLEAATKKQVKLRKMQADFVNKTQSMARADKHKAVLLTSKDRYRINELKRILDGHQIQHYALAKTIKTASAEFIKGDSLIVPMQQPQYRLIKSLFESRKAFEDNVFYDVSAWNLAEAFDLNYAFIGHADYSSNLLAKTSPEQPEIKQNKLLGTKALGLAFDWSDFNVARLLSQMQQKGLIVQGVTKPTQVKTSNGERNLSLGSVVLMLDMQTLAGRKQDRKQILEWLTPRISQLGIEAIEIETGLTISGVDMGSPGVPVLKPVKPLLLVGDGVKSYDAGEVWHLLDQRLSQPLSMLTLTQFKRMKKIDYTHLILVDGSYKFDDKNTAKIRRWVEQGGVIIAHSKAAKWLTAQGWTSSQLKPFEKKADSKAVYADKERLDAENLIGGAIGYAKIDNSHPLGFGLDNTSLSIFKRGQQVFTEPKEAFVGVARFTDKPHAAGYISATNVDHIAGATSIFVQRLGKGRLIGFSDNPVFRGFWLGTSRVFVNALYYGRAIKAPEKSKEPAAKAKLESKK